MVADPRRQIIGRRHTLRRHRNLFILQVKIKTELSGDTTRKRDNQTIKVFYVMEPVLCSRQNIRILTE